MIWPCFDGGIFTCILGIVAMEITTSFVYSFVSQYLHRKWGICISILDSRQVSLLREIFVHSSLLWRNHLAWRVFSCYLEWGDSWLYPLPFKTFTKAVPFVFPLHFILPSNRPNTSIRMKPKSFITPTWIQRLFWDIFEVFPYWNPTFLKPHPLRKNQLEWSRWLSKSHQQFPSGDPWHLDKASHSVASRSSFWCHSVPLGAVEWIRWDVGMKQVRNKHNLLISTCILK